MSGRGGKYRILAHLRGGDATEASLVMVEGGKPGADLAVLKRLKLGGDAEPQVLARFGDEARLCMRLDHPNLAKLIEAGQDADGPILVFEYVEGPTLARLRSRAARREGGLPLRLALLIAREIAKGLEYAHTLKDESGKPLRIVHRDVSPDNVTITYDGRVKVSDFGMASTASMTASSRENRVKGNVGYMAPEQLRAEFALDPRADLFALGVILWELVTGKRLWEGLSEVDVLARLGEEKALPSVKTVVPSVPDAVDALVAQALTKVRDERFDAASDFLEALDKALAKHKDLAATEADLAAFVTTLFADERAKMRAVVDEARASSTDSQRALPAIGTPRAPDVNPLADIESDPRLRFGVLDPEDAPAKRVVEVVKIEPATDHRFAYIMAAVGVVLLGTLAVVAVNSRSEAPARESGPYVAPTRPGATEAPAPATTAEPQEVNVEIKVTPVDAKLFVDGVRTKNPHRTRVLPAAFRHQIKAEADGFEPRSMVVAFDRERSIEIALTPTPKPVYRPAAPKPATPAASATEAPAPPTPPPATSATASP